MAVLINMEMPKEDIMMILSPDGTVTFMDHKTAEAVEVPEPHGRLIDADATLKLLQGLGNRDYRREKGTIMEAMKMLSYEEYTPTIIPASEEGEA